MRLMSLFSIVAIASIINDIKIARKIQKAHYVEIFEGKKLTGLIALKFNSICEMKTVSKNFCLTVCYISLLRLTFVPLERSITEIFFFNFWNVIFHPTNR